MILGYETVPVKLFCGQKISPVYDLEQLTQSLPRYLNSSTLDVTAVYAGRFYQEVCQLSKAALILHGHAVDHVHWQANWKFVIELLEWLLEQELHCF